MSGTNKRKSKPTKTPLSSDLLQYKGKSRIPQLIQKLKTPDETSRDFFLRCVRRAYEENKKTPTRRQQTGDPYVYDEAEEQSENESSDEMDNDFDE